MKVGGVVSGTQVSAPPTGKYLSTTTSSSLSLGFQIHGGYEKGTHLVKKRNCRIDVTNISGVYCFYHKGYSSSL